MRSPILRNVFSNWGAMAIAGVITFLLTPVLIRSLGDFHYGLWALAVTVLDYYGLLDFGIRTTLQRFVGRIKGMSQRDALNETAATALGISAVVGVVVLLITAVMTPVLPSFFHVQAAARTVFYWLLILMGLSIAVFFPGRMLGAYLCGLQRFDLFNAAAIATNVIRAILTLLVLYLGYGVIGVGVVMLFSAFFTLAVNYYFVKRADPQLTIHWNQVRWARMLELLSFSAYVFASNLGDYLRFYANSGVIGRLLSVAAITPFSIVVRLMSYFRQVVFGCVGPLMPRMSELEGQLKPDELRQLFLRGTRAATLLSLFIGSVLVLNGRDLLRLWLGERFVGTYPLLAMFTLGYVITLAQWPARDLMYAKGRHRPLAGWTLGEGIANLSLSIFWVMKYGLFGVALGTVIPMLVTGLLIQPWYALHLLKISAAQYIREALLRPLLTCGVFLLASRYALSFSSFDTGLRIPGFLLAVSLETLLFMCLTYVVGITRGERKSVLQRCRSVNFIRLSEARP